MKKHWCWLFSKCLQVLFVLVLTHTSWAQGSSAVYSIMKPADVLVTPNGQSLLIAYEVAGLIEVRNLVDPNQIEHRILLDNAPSGMVCNGDLLYVTLSSDQNPNGSLLTYRLSTMERIQQLSVGQGAHCPILNPSGNELYLLNEWSSDVSIIDLDQYQEVQRIKVLRQPTAACLSPDGQRLYVGNFLPETPSDGSFTASAVTVLDLQGRSVKVDQHIRLTNGSNAIRGMAMSPSGDRVLISHSVGRFMLLTSQLDQGWMYTAGLSVIETETDSLVASVVLDDHTDGAANPWEICFSGDGQTLFVAHAGVHEVSIIDYAAFLQKLNETQDSYDLHNQFGFLEGIRQRINIQGHAPRALAAVGDKLYVTCYFSDSLTTLEHDTVATATQLNPDYAPDVVTQGEMAYHDATYCHQRWQSCISCHPDARSDGLNWDLLNDGTGNPKNVKSHLYSSYTPPVMATGVRASAEVATRAGFKFIQFSLVSDDKLEAIDEYLRSLTPIPSPYLVEGGLSPAAQRGQALFNDFGCGHCHSGSYTTNMKTYSMGVLGQYDSGPYDGHWDTPSLNELWRSGPYLHDGRYATIEELLRDGAVGDLSGLSEQDLVDLAEYIKSL